MNNMLKRLLVAALAISASHVSAHTNKTFLSSPRAQRASLALDGHLTRDLAATKGKDRFGGNFLVSGFYSESLKKASLGKYFGVADKDSFKANAGTFANNDADVNAGFLVHSSNPAPVVAGAAATHGATINLAPKTISYGVEFAYVQCLGKILDGLHLSIALPVERVENTLGLNVTNGIAAGDAKVLTDFLAGNLSRAASGNDAWTNANANAGSQAALKNGLIDGKRSATGIADIDVILGYDFVRNEDWKAGLNIGLVIPTGNTAAGKYAFEPVYGNGGHWELGFGGHVCGNLWKDADQRVGLHLGADYRYGFKASETRTLGGKENWSQYFLVGAVNAGNIAALQFQPAANLATTSVDVTPNSSLRGNLGLEYGNGGFLFGVHYAPAWRQAESVALKTVEADDKYAVVNPIADTNIAGALTAVGFNAAQAANAAVSGAGVKKADIVLDRTARPSQVAHRLGADMGYTFKEWEYPVTIGVGGHYEIAGDNAVAENWAVSVKAGIGF